MQPPPDPAAGSEGMLRTRIVASHRCRRVTIMSKGYSQIPMKMAADLTRHTSVELTSSAEFILHIMPGQDPPQPEDVIELEAPDVPFELLPRCSQSMWQRVKVKEATGHARVLVTGNVPTLISQHTAVGWALGVVEPPTVVAEGGELVKPQHCLLLYTKEQEKNTLENTLENPLPDGGDLDAALSQDVIDEMCKLAHYSDTARAMFKDGLIAEVGEGNWLKIGNGNYRITIPEIGKSSCIREAVRAAVQVDPLLQKYSSLIPLAQAARLKLATKKASGQLTFSRR